MNRFNFQASYYKLKKIVYFHSRTRIWCTFAFKGQAKNQKLFKKKNQKMVQTFWRSKINSQIERRRALLSSLDKDSELYKVD